MMIFYHNKPDSDTYLESLDKRGIYKQLLQETPRVILCKGFLRLMYQDYAK